MRTLLLAASLLAAGCMSTVDMPSPQDDAGTGPTHDLAEQQSPGSDMARVGYDLAGSMGNPNGAAFGATCTQNSDCMSGMCELFRMHTIMLCTQPCTAATQATDCPNPPSAGTCTPNNWCRFQ
jgi:hypothetical protein